MTKLKDDWTLYAKTTRPDPEVGLRIHQAWHSGAVAMFTRMIDVLGTPDITESERRMLLKRLGQDAGDGVLSTVAPGRLQQAMYELMGSGPGE